MSKELITREYKGIGVHFEIINGESYVSVEDVARFCGWTQIKGDKEYIRYERINEKLSFLSFPNVGENDFIPENIMYTLIGMADLNKNPKARDFMLWVGKVIAEIRQTGSYTIDPKNHIDEVNNAKVEMELMSVTADILNFSDNSKLMLAHEIYKNNNISEKYLPSYTKSEGVLKSATELLKANNMTISTVKFNSLLVKKGILKECTRKSTKDETKTKKFKNLVNTYYGENLVNPRNTKETQPMYYEDKFKELLKEIDLI